MVPTGGNLIILTLFGRRPETVKKRRGDPFRRQKRKETD